MDVIALVAVAVARFWPFWVKGRIVSQLMTANRIARRVIFLERRIR